MLRTELEKALEKIKETQVKLENIGIANPFYFKLKGFQNVVKEYLRMFEFQIDDVAVLDKLDNDMSAYEVMRLIESMITSKDHTQEMLLTKEQREVLKLYLPQDTKKYTVNDIRVAIMLSLMNEYFIKNLRENLEEYRTTGNDWVQVAMRKGSKIASSIAISLLWMGQLISFYLGLEKHADSNIVYVFQQAVKVVVYGLVASMNAIAIFAWQFSKNPNPAGDAFLSAQIVGFVYTCLVSVAPILLKDIGTLIKRGWDSLVGRVLFKRNQKITLMNEKEIRRVLIDVAAHYESTSSSSVIFISEDAYKKYKLKQKSRSVSKPATPKATKAPKMSSNTKYYTALDNISKTRLPI